MRQTYITLEGHVLNLTSLTEKEWGYLLLCNEQRQRVDAIEFGNEWVNSKRNPVLKASGGCLDRDVWEHPLYQALWDMSMRKDVEDGRLRLDAHSDTGDPFRDPAALRQPERERRSA